MVDVPYNGDPALVQPIDGARALLDRLRSRGVRVGVLTNQSGVGRGTITQEQMRAVNARVEMLLGPFDGWFICPHAPQDDCECRKPKPQLIYDAAAAWGMTASEIAVVGDKESDVKAAENAGAIGVRISDSTPLRALAEGVLS